MTFCSGLLHNRSKGKLDVYGYVAAEVWFGRAKMSFVFCCVLCFLSLFMFALFVFFAVLLKKDDCFFLFLYFDAV